MKKKVKNMLSDAYIKKSIRRVSKKIYRKHKNIINWIVFGLFIVTAIYLFVREISIKYTALQFPSSRVSQDAYATQTLSDIKEMKVHFIDVGQGDATLITCGKEAMLIDAGDNSKGTTVQLYLNNQGIRNLKYLVLTHPDADHIGGADVIVTKFPVETVFMADFTKDNKTYNDLIQAIKNKHLKWTTPNVGNTYTLGSATFTIIAPNTTYEDPNNSSIGLLLRNGKDTFLFTGDAEEEAEYDILANGLDIDCDVFQAGHHGSSTSNSKDFLDCITPEYVVISCEEGNSYGHPHAEPMNMCRRMGVQLFRTDEQGSIIAISNGNGIKWNCAPTESWKSGERMGPSSK